MSVYMCIIICTCVYLCVYVHPYNYVYIHVCTWDYLCVTCVCLCVYIFIFVCVYACRYICIFVCEDTESELKLFVYAFIKWPLKEEILTKQSLTRYWQSPDEWWIAKSGMNFRNTLAKKENYQSCVIPNELTELSRILSLIFFLDV